jgi:pimeloyl-ACP methyl ester carboxylesterase
MPRGAPVDGFELAYDREGTGPPVILLHGWPGSRTDYDELQPRLRGIADLVVPDLRGFGDSDRHDRPPRQAYTADAQATSVLGLVDELGLDRPVLVGYDIGSRTAQAVARRRPEAVRALVLSPPLPGIGGRILTEAAVPEFWYQAFHQLPLAEALIDGRPGAVRAYLDHFWGHWSAPGWSPSADRLDRLVRLYARPGAFRASIAWYRAGAGAVAQAAIERAPRPDERIAVPTTVICGEHDPLFPPAWSDRLAEFLADAEVRVVPGAGHFTPIEATAAIAGAVERRLRT